jgi:hypothetical protein
MSEYFISNDPTKPGQRATAPEPICDGRYLLFAVHTRFDAVTWMVEDLATPDEVCGLPTSIIRQESTRAQAIAGLTNNTTASNQAASPEIQWQRNFAEQR